MTAWICHSFSFITRTVPPSWKREAASKKNMGNRSRGCREFERRMSRVMRQHHVTGDKVFVDYSGKTIAIVNPATGELRQGHPVGAG